MISAKKEEFFVKFAMIISTLLIISLLLLILFSITQKALSAISLEMITQIPSGGYYFGKKGGILNAIAGSIYLSAGSTILAFIVCLPVAMAMNTKMMNKGRIISVTRFLLDLMWGIPSIVYGAIGFTIMIFFGFKTSLLAGIITVTVFILPIMIRSMDEVLKEVPKELQEASYSIGANISETAFRVIIKQCFPGIATAVLLSFCRAIGDAASVLFTCGFTDFIPESIFEPAATLPLSIFFQLGSPVPQVQSRAYASAFILISIVLIISIIIRIFSSGLNRNRINL